MSAFEWFTLLGILCVCIGLGGMASALEKSAKHLSNIADRLLDIEKTLRERR